MSTRNTLLAVALVLAGLAAAGALPPPNLDRAVAAQRALVAKEPSAEHYNDLGNLLLLAEDKDGAREAYEQALELDEDLADAHYNLGLLFQQTGRERSALRHFREVVELMPDHAWAWFQIGSLHEAAGAEDAAVRALARAFALDAQLSFSDQNPQLLDSRLVTRALLRAQDELSVAAEAPRAYAEPRRIAGLLLPEPPPDDTAATAPAADVHAATTPAVPRRMQHPPAPAVAQGGAERVLRPQDLDPGSRVGEVTGGAGGRGSVTHLPPDPETTDYTELLRQRLLQQGLQGQEEAGDEVYVEGDEAAPEVFPDGTFAPAPASTGQIEYFLGDQLASLN
jgi:tetratricopeptide (TPR) repeat protein